MLHSSSCFITNKLQNVSALQNRSTFLSHINLPLVIGGRVGCGLGKKLFSMVSLKAPGKWRLFNLHFCGFWDYSECQKRRHEGLYGVLSIPVLEVIYIFVPKFYWHSCMTYSKGHIGTRGTWIVNTEQLVPRNSSKIIEENINFWWKTDYLCNTYRE